MSRLLSAVFANNLEEIRRLLDRDPKRVNDMEALCQGIGWGRKEAVRLLVRRGANLNSKDRNGNHPLSMACQSSATELFEELVRSGSDPTRADGLASDAAWSGRNDILRYLQQAGFDLNKTRLRGVRRIGPIEAAVGMGHLATVEYLLSVNVDISTIDVSKPLRPWKGALPDKGAMEEIRKLIAAQKQSKHGQ